MKGRKRVLLDLPMAQQDGIGKYNGIMRFVREANANWHIRLDRQSHSPNVAQHNDPMDFDGVIIDPGTQDEHLQKLLTLKTPLVIIDCREPEMTARRRRCIQIEADNAEIGREAANILVNTGTFAAFAFMPTPVKTNWSSKRYTAFQKTLMHKGLNATVLDTNKSLANQLRALPKPAAVFAANDILADIVLTECAYGGIAVPEDVSVLGVDNEEITCYHATPPLASIQPNFDQAGYLAAQALDSLLRGKCPVRRRIYHVKRLVPRSSLGPARSAGRLVQRALELIGDSRQHFTNIDEIAKALGVSRRLLDLRFRQIKSRSIKDVILDRQFERICTALTTTNLSIAEIAAESGIGTDKHPLRAFKKRFGMTMSDYRDTARARSFQNPPPQK